ncbi:DUF2196 domain-containing protein [archaeon]|jgi:uncharacterized repeat protein (TIGR03833 family)|nr:DUF2196 domain-containing protein [archaeon]
MDLPGNYLKNVSEGMDVEVNPQKDRTRKKRVKGVVKKILSRTPEHTHGILVELDNGEIGRIKTILDFSSGSVNDPSSKASNTVDVKPPDTEEIHSSDESVSQSKTKPKFDIEKTIENPKEENHFVEFKTSSLWSVRYSDQQIRESSSYEIKEYGRNASKFIIAKTIGSFLNSDGGHLIVGVKENKIGGNNEVIGIESEFFKLQDPCLDGYRRMIVDQIIKLFFPAEVFHHINDYMEINFKEIDEKTVCHILVRPSKTKVFINFKNKGHFFIRIDASSRELRGEDVVDYCLRRFT